MVTAEIAVGLTALVFVLFAGLWVVSAVAQQVRCIDAARDTARAIARGESDEVAMAAGRRSAPAGASIVIADQSGWVEVTVSVQALPGWPGLAALPSVTVDGHAAVAYEPLEAPNSSSPAGSAEPGQSIEVANGVESER